MIALMGVAIVVLTYIANRAKPRPGANGMTWRFRLPMPG